MKKMERLFRILLLVFILTTSLTSQSPSGVSKVIQVSLNFYRKQRSGFSIHRELFYAI